MYRPSILPGLPGVYPPPRDGMSRTRGSPAQPSGRHGSFSPPASSPPPLSPSEANYRPPSADVGGTAKSPGLIPTVLLLQQHRRGGRACSCRNKTSRRPSAARTPPSGRVLHPCREPCGWVAEEDHLHTLFLGTREGVPDCQATVAAQPGRDPIFVLSPLLSRRPRWGSCFPNGEAGRLGRLRATTGRAFTAHIIA
jgi:hypothetical protein